MSVKTARIVDERKNDRNVLGVLIGLAVLCFLLMPWYNVVDYDVAFLTWAADQVMEGAVYGRDILEVNPPSCILIYMPAVLLGNFVGLEWGIRLWMLLLTVMSITCLWQTSSKTLRLTVALMVLVFVTLAFPNFFAQREQIVFLLCVPYVAGVASERRWGILSGIMAGMGFMMKPYFLIPLAVMIAWRRKFGTEERAIIFVGASYAVILFTFFGQYLWEMIPAAVGTYWAISFPWTTLLVQAAFILLLATLAACIGVRRPEALSYFWATIGFTAAAALQLKGFFYHFIPAYGFLAIYLLVKSLGNRPVIAVATALLILAEALAIGRYELDWRNQYIQGDKLRPLHQAEIDSAASFVSFVPEPYAAFPAAIHTKSRYVGIAGFPIFIPAVARYATGLAVGDPAKAEELAMSQALHELGRNPDLVITLDQPYDIEGRSFDILDWYKRDPRFREAWKNYVSYKVIGQLRLFRRTHQ